MIGASTHGTIYALLDPREPISLSNTRYVGLTRQTLTQRLTNHVSTAKTESPQYVKRWVRSLLSDGVRPVIYPLESFIPVEKLGESEIAWISRLRELGCNLTNTSPGGEAWMPRKSRGQSICAIADCERVVHGRGWCGMHYKRWVFTGDPLNARYERPTWQYALECVHGHPYDDVNTGYDRGRRYCKECNRARARDRYRRKHGLPL